VLGADASGLHPCGDRCRVRFPLPCPPVPTPPPPTPTPTPTRRWRIALALYWGLLFVVTHLPQINQHTVPQWELLPFDKTMHFLTFGGLAGLLCWSRFLRPAGPWPNAGLAFGVGAAYGVLEELTQPWFGRTNDPGDLVADALGLAVGATLAALLWKLPHGPRTSRTPASEEA